MFTRFFSLALAASVLAGVPSYALAQDTAEDVETEESSSPITGFISLQTGYLDDNTLNYSPGQSVVQGGLTLDLGNGLYLDTWGSHGLEDDTGAELDIGAFYVIGVNDDTEIVVSAYHYFLADSPDVAAFSAGIVHGPVDVTVTYYVWAFDDVVRVSAGYSADITEALSVRPVITYESAGFWAREISVGGDTTYMINDTLGFNAGVRSDFTDTRFVAGLTASF